MMQELRDKIISYAHIRFLNGGIKWLNLDYIAYDCSISRKTLNQYFNRNQLIDAAIKSKIETYHQSLLKLTKELLLERPHVEALPFLCIKFYQSLPFVER